MDRHDGCQALRRAMQVAREEVRTAVQARQAPRPDGRQGRDLLRALRATRQARRGVTFAYRIGAPMRAYRANARRWGEDMRRTFALFVAAVALAGFLDVADSNPAFA